MLAISLAHNCQLWDLQSKLKKIGRLITFAKQRVSLFNKESIFLSEKPKIEIMFYFRLLGRTLKLDDAS